jgi:hypothetical protein
MSYCQKNKWVRDLMKLWFYMKTPISIRTLEDGTMTVFPYALEMKEMKPLSKVDPLAMLLEEQKACDKAFTLACWYSEVRIWWGRWWCQTFRDMGDETRPLGWRWFMFRCLGLRRVFLSLGLIRSLVKTELRNLSWRRLSLACIVLSRI